MNRRIALFVPAAGLAAALGTLALSQAGAQAPAPSAQGSAAAPAQGSAAAQPAPSTAAAATAPAADEKPIDFEPIPPPPEKLKVPGASEWQSATPVRFTARGPRAAKCRMLRVREWLKVRCEGQTTAIGLMGGAPDGAFYWLPQAKEGEPAPPNAEVMFPMKPGDRRVFELFSYGPAYGGSMISPGLVLQEHWIAGEPAPVVVIR